MTTVNLLFAIDKKCISYLQSCMWSICKNGGADRYDVYVLHSDLTDSEQELLNSTLPDNITWSFIEVPDNMFSGFPVNKKYPEQIYYRLAAPLLLPDSIDRILYLGVDIIVINSLMKLYSGDFEENWFMGCTNTPPFLTKINQVRLDIDTKKNNPYINSGVLLMNLPVLKENIKFDEIREYAENKKRALILPDQDILTALYGDKVKLLDNLIYNLSDRTLRFKNASSLKKKYDLNWVKDNTVIIHYFGSNKPWKNGYTGILDVFYHESEQDRIKNSKKPQSVFTAINIV